MYGWLTTSKGKPPSKAMDKGKYVRKIYLFKSLLLCLTSVRQVLYAKILQKWSFDDDVCSLAQTGAWPKKYFCKTTVIRHEDCKTICNYVHFVQTRDAARKPGYYWDWWHYCAHNRHSVDRNMQASNRYVFWSAASEPQSCQEQGHNPFSRLINIFVRRSDPQYDSVCGKTWNAITMLTCWAISHTHWFLVLQCRNAAIWVTSADIHCVSSVIAKGVNSHSSWSERWRSVASRRCGFGTKRERFWRSCKTGRSEHVTVRFVSKSIKCNSKVKPRWLSYCRI